MAEDPSEFKGGEWAGMYVKPGSTICFPSGTINLVYRTEEHPTLAIGGHIMQLVRHIAQVRRCRNPAATPKRD